MIALLLTTTGSARELQKMATRQTQVEEEVAITKEEVEEVEEEELEEVAVMAP